MKLVKTLFAVITLLVIANVTLTNRSVDESLVVSDLVKEISTLQNSNIILAGQIAASGSIGALSEKIKAAGFVDSTKVVSLSNTSSVALR